MNFIFFFNTALIGVGLAMDAFSVSVANALNEPDMKKARLAFMAFIFSFFQFIMPLTGWLCVHKLLEHFVFYKKYIPFISFLLLVLIGSDMIEKSSDNSKKESDFKRVGISTLIFQGVATSIDALTVGFAIAEYDIFKAFISCLIISLTTFLICTSGLVLGKKIGSRAAGKGSVLGGAILIFIGMEIFITGIF